MSSFAALLAEVFTAQGWKTTRDAALEGRSGTVYAAPVLVEQGDVIALIERRGPDVEITEALIEEMARVVDDTGADMGVLAHLGPIDHDAVRAAEGRIILWDRLTCALLIGETHVALASGSTLPDLPLGPSVIAPVQPPVVPLDRAPMDAAPLDAAPLASAAFESEGPSDLPELAAPPADGGLFDFMEAPTEATAPTEVFDLDGLLPDAFAEPSAPAASTAAEAVAPTAAPPAAPLSGALPSLPIRIAAAQALSSVQDRLFSAAGDADLVLQPVYLFDYECDLLVEGSLEYDTVTGRVEVHGTNKTVQEVDPIWIDLAQAGPIPSDPQTRSVDERPVRITPERATELAHASLMKQHSRIVEIETMDDDEDFVMMERKDVTPRPDQVRVQPLGTVYRPRWRVNGPNGACLVDAITGDVLSEDLRTPDPDIIMLD